VNPQLGQSFHHSGFSDHPLVFMSLGWWRRHKTCDLVAPVENVGANLNSSHKQKKIEEPQISQIAAD
jgi:hypothetical protein